MNLIVDCGGEREGGPGAGAEFVKIIRARVCWENLGPWLEN